MTTNEGPCLRSKLKTTMALQCCGQALPIQLQHQPSTDHMFFCWLPYGSRDPAADWSKGIHPRRHGSRLRSWAAQASVSGAMSDVLRAKTGPVRHGVTQVSPHYPAACRGKSRVASRSPRVVQDLWFTGWRQWSANEFS